MSHTIFVSVVLIRCHSSSLHRRALSSHVLSCDASLSCVVVRRHHHTNFHTLLTAVSWLGLAPKRSALKMFQCPNVPAPQR